MISKYKHFISVLVSALAIAMYLLGYIIIYNTDFREFGLAPYMLGLLWFYVAWLVGISQIIFGTVQHIRKQNGSQAVLAGVLVLAAQALMFGFGKLGWYLTV